MAASAVLGCGGDDGGGGPAGPGGGPPTGTGFWLPDFGDASEGFVSDAPEGGSNAAPLMAAESVAMGAADKGSAADSIAEADVVAIDGDRLYTLSRYGGLAIVDVSNPDAMKVLGHRSIGGTPFEMYVRGSVLVTMADDVAKMVGDEKGALTWVQTSRVQAFDVSDPSKIVPIGAFDLPGALSDSRIVGDVLYVVTFESGACWECADVPTTTITSLSLATPSSISRIDQIAFAEPADAWAYGWRRSVTVNPQRMYVAGIEYSGSGAGRSTIQVVDISDPSGKLVLGAFVEAAGQIESRWQMDEHDGVLRVVSQPGIWETSAPVRIQTFGVSSSHSLMPLANVPLVLPKAERLRAVRFDGDRGYAITAEQKDPLFTLDLSSPTSPRQVAELEMPGFIHHIEPRGDRLITLGFDQEAAGGSLHLSLFDVADMDKPILLDREAFGGDWSVLPEDQDRIHKALGIAEDTGMVLVPFAGYDFGPGCGSGRIDGVQLFDWKGDSLTRRGLAQTRGPARRGLMHAGRLLAMSDFAVRSYDVTNRDAPIEKHAVGLATDAAAAIFVGEHVARLPGGEGSSTTRLEIVSAGAPNAPDAIGAVDLSTALASGHGDATKDDAGWCSPGTSGALLFAHPPFVYVVTPVAWESTRVIVVDASTPARPLVAGHVDVPAPLSIWGPLGHYGRIPAAGSSVVQHGSTLVFLDEDEPESYDDPNALRHARLFVVDLAKATRPVIAATHELPDAIGHTALVAEGTMILSSHWVPEPGHPEKVRFWLDRVSIAEPKKPVAMPAVNVPGALVAFDAASDRALLLDFVRENKHGMLAEDCWRLFGGTGRWKGPATPTTTPSKRAATSRGAADVPPDVHESEIVRGTCSVLHRVFALAALGDEKAELLDRLAVADDTLLSRLFAGDDRVFATQNGPFWPLAEPAIAVDTTWAPSTSSRVLAIGGLRAGRLQSTWIDVDGGAEAHAADGSLLVMSSWSPPVLLVVDASKMTAPRVTTLAELNGSPWSVSISDGVALCSMGPYGLASVDLETD